MWCSQASVVLPGFRGALRLTWCSQAYVAEHSFGIAVPKGHSIHPEKGMMGHHQFPFALSFQLWAPKNPSQGLSIVNKMMETPFPLLCVYVFVLHRLGV